MTKQIFTVAAVRISVVSQQGTAILYRIASSYAIHSRIIILVIAMGNGTERDC